MKIIKNNSYQKIFLMVLFMLLLVLSACTKVPADDDNDDDPIGENGDNTDQPIDEVLDPYPIGLNIENYKDEYALNEQFNATIGKAEALYSDGVVKDVTSSIVVDSKKFDNTKDGTYEIIVSYEENLNNRTYVVKSFYLAVVGTGEGTGGGGGGDDEQKVFGPGTYTFDGSIDLVNYEQSAAILSGTKFADGFFVMKGADSKRANATAYAIELVKAEGSWIEFEVNVSATVSLVCSSTGSNNTSVIAIFDEESQLVNNNESITTLTGTTQVTLTYTLTTGKYRVLSQANTSYSSRGVRVYKLTVVQE